MTHEVLLPPFLMFPAGTIQRRVKRRTTPVLSVVNADGTTEAGSLIDDIVREGARRMLAAALEAEVDACIAELANQRDERRRRLVVRNGYHQPRKVTGDPAAMVPQVPEDQRGAAAAVSARPVLRRLRTRAGAVPWQLRRALAGDHHPAHPAVAGRPSRFGERDLSDSDYVYVWADGIHLRIRLREAKSCVLVVMGVRADGTKELIAMTVVYRESADSWADLLWDCRRRDMRAPVLAVGDGALGFWKALAEVFPEARHRRCWVHKTANVTNALPQSAQPGAKKALQEICNAEDRDHALNAVSAFEQAYGAKFPKAVKKITDDVDELLAFYDFPAEHWIHLRTTNPIESTFATVRLRTKVTKGAGSAAAALAMVFKLVESAQAR
ncbi:IS256 family transposase [Streptomyces alanosinicus]|uniref:Mutator family transposase n=1 Tax=Streptomyces alanosinicus TaxID=68171 RepID=A0A918YS11_9ACTN|nr:IS256 family transposase [Streptomyces alanosinicus]